MHRHCFAGLVGPQDFKPEASRGSTELRIVRQEEVYFFGFSNGDGGCKVNRIQGSNDSRKSLARPLHDSFVERMDCQRLVNRLYFFYQVGYFAVGDFVQ